jgi:hypothetical protein
MSDLITAGPTREKADALAVAVVPYVCHMGKAVRPTEKKITYARPARTVLQTGGCPHG